MSIFGRKGVKTHIRTGTFKCPSCLSTQVYTLKKVTNFHSFLTVPLIRCEEEDPYVECQSCCNKYIPRVLDYDPGTKDQVFLNLYQDALTRTLALIVLTDQTHSLQKKMLMLSMLKKFGGDEMQMSDLEVILQRESRSKEMAFEKLLKLKNQMNGNGRNLILKCALTVATVDGPLNEIDLVIITKLAETLGISSQNLVNMLSSSSAEAA